MENFGDFAGGSDSKESACNAGDLGSIPGSGRFPWRRECIPTPVFLPRGSHRQRSLASYNPWGLKESDMTEQLSIPHKDLDFLKITGGYIYSGKIILKGLSEH